MDEVWNWPWEACRHAVISLTFRPLDKVDPGQGPHVVCVCPRLPPKISNSKHTEYCYVPACSKVA